jgi:uncharacterized membrane protein YgdD (TMEM256/DUF423 family)
MHKTFLIIASLLAALAVVLGAFGAHGLKKIVPADTVATFQTGVQYQMYHAFALFIVAILYERFANANLQYAGIMFLTGIILFSGSLYLLVALKATEKTGLGGIGIITPIGGLCFIVGWILLLVGILKK